MLLLENVTVGMTPPGQLLLPARLQLASAAMPTSQPDTVLLLMVTALYGTNAHTP